jgi:hypothetical protein
MRNYTFLFILLLALNTNAQEIKTEVLTLGVFHFNFPNRDVVKTVESDQIDVLEPKYQNEIITIVEKIETFKPTIIVIERHSSQQKETDSIFELYLKNKYDLKRNEEEQIGFRLAKRINIKKIYCVDEWGEFNQEIKEVIFENDTITRRKFTDYIQENKDSGKKFKREPIFKNHGILEELKELNNAQSVRKSLGNYLIGSFKFENKEGDFFGANFETGRWFNRNLKIFRNIQRINLDPNDKILVIFGADHMNILNILFESSPEFKLVDTNEFLNKKLVGNKI